MKVLIEIRPAEGGEDAKLLVHDQLGIYVNYCKRRGLACELVDEGKG